MLSNCMYFASLIGIIAVILFLIFDALETEYAYRIMDEDNRNDFDMQQRYGWHYTQTMEHRRIICDKLSTYMLRVVVVTTCTTLLCGGLAISTGN